MMEFINRISHSLFFVTGAGVRKSRQMWWIAVCALLAAMAAGLTQFNHRWQSRQRHAQAGQVAALRGEAAVRRLKTDGGYAPLAAARYQINAASARSGQASQSGPPFYANNPGQRLHATFASDEVSVNATSNKTDGKTGGAELRLRLAGKSSSLSLSLTPPAGAVTEVASARRVVFHDRG